MASNQARLLELAKRQARRSHEHAIYAASNGHPDEGHTSHAGYDYSGFDVCQHPDCELVRETALAEGAPAVRQDESIVPDAEALLAEMDGCQDTYQREAGVLRVLLGQFAYVRQERDLLLSLFGDYEEPCGSYDEALSIYNAMRERETATLRELQRLIVALDADPPAEEGEP